MEKQTVPNPREQARAYESGVQDGRMGISLRDVSPCMIQQRSGWADESVVCYLNGVGDGWHGPSAD